MLLQPFTLTIARTFARTRVPRSHEVGAVEDRIASRNAAFKRALGLNTRTNVGKNQDTKTTGLG